MDAPRMSKPQSPFLKFIIAAVIIVFGFLITPALERMAYEERGYEAVGGEYAPLVLSFLAAAIVMQTMSEHEAKVRREPQEKDTESGCEENAGTLSAVRPQTDGPELNSDGVREDMRVKNNGDCFAGIPSATEEASPEN